MSEQFWTSTWFLPLPISKLMAMKLLALGSQINATQFFLSVQICGGLKHDFTHCSYASNIIATLKVEGWQKRACILNLDNCAAACKCGAEQSITVPLLQVAEDNWMDACIQAEVTSTGVWEAEVMCLLPGYIQPWADLLYVLLSCNMLFLSFGDWLSGKGNRFYLCDCY